MNGQPSEDRAANLEKRVEFQRHILADWAGLNRYGSDNSELPPPKPSETRTVFFGDGVFDNWPADTFFPGKPYLNRGISGQTSAQMLVRFRQDVILLKPKVAVIAAGSSDIASILGPITQPMTADNIMTMVELAKLHGIKTILTSVTPVCDCVRPQTKLRPPGKIMSLNGWIKEYAAESGSVYLNLHSALAEGRTFKKTLTADGLIPNEAGYAMLAPLVEAAIAQVTKEQL